MKLSLTKNVSALFRGSLSDAFKEKMEDCLFQIFLTQVGPLPSPWLQPPYFDPKREGKKKKVSIPRSEIRASSALCVEEKI